MEVTPALLPPLLLEPGLNVTLIRNAQGLKALEDYFARCNGVTGWDIETNMADDFWWRRVRTIQFGNTQEQYVIDLLAFCPGVLDTCQGQYGKNLAEAPGLQVVLDTISPVLCNRDILKVGVNLGFEYACMYWSFGLRTQYFFDCSLVERVIWAGLHSLKDYPFYSMEQLMQRYFRVQIDKSLQESFTLDQDLTWPQVEYAALDTRLPLGIRTIQNKILTSKKPLAGISPLLTGDEDSDDLTRVADLENDAIGAFQDMHLHGERIDCEKWLIRTAGKQAELDALIKTKLDPIFIDLPGIGNKDLNQDEVDQLHAVWKGLNEVTQDELDLKLEIRNMKRADPEIAAFMQDRYDLLVARRKEQKDHHKAIWSEASKHLTRVRNLAKDCEGNALINYASRAQLLKALNTHFSKQIGKELEELDDDTFDDYAHIPVMGYLREYRKLSKEISTYGVAWTKQWVTGPGTEAWLHPMDGRLHCTFNQLEAETGRSSSSQPNAQNLPRDPQLRSCFIVDPPDEEEPDGYIMVTADMSGAELRILAELADEPVWINAFNLKEDVHAVCTEMVEAELWPSLALPGCAYYQLREDGSPAHKKCKCPQHNVLRDGMKPTNFGLPYGISYIALSRQIGKSTTETRQLMNKHQEAFPKLWEYLAKSGSIAKLRMKSFDMFGRRRIFPEPDDATAFKRAMEYGEEDLRLPEEEVAANKAAFLATHDRKPTPEEKWLFKHRIPIQKEVNSAKAAMYGSIERQGKNHAIQGTNASIAKIAMGAGHSPDGKPYLWHTLRTFKARLVKFVHDELVVQCPRRHGEAVAALIGDAFKRAGAEVMSKVTMEFDYHMEVFWCK